MKNLLIILGLTSIPYFATAQPQVIDKIVGVVGDNTILLSEIEGQYSQNRQFMLGSSEKDAKCLILSNAINQKLFLAQAKLDSLQVGEDRVEDEMNRRLRYFIAQIGSQEKLEEFLGKSLVQFKDELRDNIRESILSEQMQGEITKNISITPTEVKQYYQSQPKDSLPYYNTEVELAQIVVKPKVSDEAKAETRKKLEGILARIKNGESFSTMAILYSQDPGSARKGGDLGLVARGEMVKAFEATAFRLKPGEVSGIVQTEFGYHIIQETERKADKIAIKHILIKPEGTYEDGLKSGKLADSIYQELKKGSLTFENAALTYSDDAPTKNNGGNMINSQDGTSKIPTDQLDPQLTYLLDTLKVGNYSKPQQYALPNGEVGYRIILYRSKIQPHQANMREDYQRLKTLAEANKKQTTIQNWLNKKRKETFIKVDTDYQSCNDISNWYAKLNNQ